MADQPALETLTPRLRAAAASLDALRADVDAGAPWPLSDRFGVEPEATWGPPETLAHVAEMVTFWTGELERILAGADEPVPFGRVASNPLRIGVIERDRSLPARELFGRIEAGVDRLARRLAALTPADAARRGVHPTVGELPVPAMIDRFVVSHLEEHADQLRASLGTG